MIASFGMALRYSFGMGKEADLIERSNDRSESCTTTIPSVPMPSYSAARLRSPKARKSAGAAFSAAPALPRWGRGRRRDSVRGQHAGRSDPGRQRAARAGARRAPKKGPIYLDFPGKDKGLVVIGERPLVAETPSTCSTTTPRRSSKFYIRNNGQIPEASEGADKWKITIDGEVNNRSRSRSAN
jgi:hypothetical protein